MAHLAHLALRREDLVEMPLPASGVFTLPVTAYARPRPLLIEGGHPPPLTMYYGARVSAPVYDFARLPLQSTPVPATLGLERLNPGFRVVDRRSLFARHPTLVTAALAAAAGLLVAAGALALRPT